MRMIRRVEYLKKHENEVLYDLMFNLVPRTFEKDSIVLAEEQPSDMLSFIEDGVIEVYTKFEGTEFVIEQLHKGSAINHRAFFMKDQSYVNFRCQTDAKLLQLSHQKMKELIDKYEDRPFGRDLLIYQNKILKQERKFPCDYVMRVPRTIQMNDDMAYRQNGLKNVVMRIIIDIRNRKNKPKLTHFIQVYREKKRESGASKAAIKAEFQNKFRMLYGEDQEEEKAEDIKFDQMMLNFNRLQDQLNVQQQQLSGLIKQVNATIDRRDKKENNILSGRQKNTFRDAGVTKLGSKARKNGNADDGRKAGSDAAGNDSEESKEETNRNWQHQEDQLRALESDYRHDHPESQNVSEMLKQGTKNKAGGKKDEQQFAPFREQTPQPFNDEIINTSKEIHGNGSNRASSNEMASQQSNFRNAP